MTLKQRIVGWFASGALAVAGAAPLAAQAPAGAAPATLPPGTVVEDENGYKTQVPYIDPKKKPADVAQLRIAEGKARTFAWQVLAGSLPLNDNRVAFEFYYNKMLLPSFTQTSEAALTALPEERQKLFRDHLEKSAGLETVHTELVDLVFKQMSAIVQDNYHPAVRYNAMLVISGLNDTDPVRVGANKATPEPMVRAWPFIYEQFKKPENTDAIRVAALLGLVRHLEWDNFRGPAEAPTPAIDAAKRGAVMKDLLALAQQKDPPPGRSAAGHEWFRRRAIDGLTHAGYYKVDAEVATALDALLKDESESLAMRCAAATAVGKMTYQAPVKLEPTPTAKELGYLALLACHKELTRVTDLNKQEYDRLSRLQGGGAGGYGGGASGGRSMMMPPSGATGSPDGSGGTGIYAGPRPGGTVRPQAPGSTGGSGGMMPGGMMPGGMMPGMGEGFAAGAPVSLDPKQYRFEFIRRRIRGQLYAIEVGLVGPDGFQRYLTAEKLASAAAAAPAAAAPAAAPAVAGPPRGVVVMAKDKAEKEYVKKVIDGVVKLAKAVEETDTELVDLEKELRKQMKPLEAITKKLAVAAPVAAPSDLPEMPLIPGVGPAVPRAVPAPPAPAESPAAAPPAAAPPAAVPVPMPAAPATAPMPAAVPMPAAAVAAP